MFDVLTNEMYVVKVVCEYVCILWLHFCDC